MLVENLGSFSLLTAPSGPMPSYWEGVAGNKGKPYTELLL
jgi:hypothetical protein